MNNATDAGQPAVGGAGVPGLPGSRPIAQWSRLEAGRSDDFGSN